MQQFFSSDQCHREGEFKNTLLEVQQKLLSISKFGDNIAIIAGSGTAAMEAMISSLCPKNTLIINAGKYGSRAIDIFKVFNIKNKVVESKKSDVKLLVKSCGIKCVINTSYFDYLNQLNLQAH